MKKILILGLVVLLASMSVTAQLLYKVSGNGAKGDSYILGTHHLAPLSILDSIKGFENAFNRVEAVYGEVVAEELASPQAIELMTKKAVAPPDSALSKLLTVSQRDSIAAVFKKYTGADVDMISFEPFVPALVSTQLAMLQTLSVIPEYAPAKQIDAYVQRMAEKSHKQTGGLESIEAQLDALFGAPIAWQVEVLMSAVRNDSTAGADALDLVESYMNQDIEKLTRLIAEEDGDCSPEMGERIIYKRNREWVAKMPTMIAERPVMFVVGAGHLCGERGVIPLLRQMGYSVISVR